MAWTDYPFKRLGDESPAPVRECKVIRFDGDKYVTIVVEGAEETIKRCYVYIAPGRCGEVPSIKDD